MINIPGINIYLSNEIVEFIRNQPNKSKYIEALIRKDRDQKIQYEIAEFWHTIVMKTPDRYKSVITKVLKAIDIQELDQKIALIKEYSSRELAKLAHPEVFRKNENEGDKL